MSVSHFDNLAIRRHKLLFAVFIDLTVSAVLCVSAALSDQLDLIHSSLQKALTNFNSFSLTPFLFTVHFKPSRLLYILLAFFEPFSDTKALRIIRVFFVEFSWKI